MMPKFNAQSTQFLSHDVLNSCGYQVEMLVVRVTNGDVPSIQIDLPRKFFRAAQLHLQQAYRGWTSQTQTRITLNSSNFNENILTLHREHHQMQSSLYEIYYIIKSESKLFTKAEICILFSAISNS